jgi:hypothetical protein
MLATGDWAQLGYGMAYVLDELLRNNQFPTVLLTKKR